MPTVCDALLAPYLYIGIYMPAILPHMVNKKKDRLKTGKKKTACKDET